MPRINLEERLFSDARFIDFMFSVGDKEKAVGAFALACVAGARWYLKDPDRMIPVAEWKKQKLNDGLIEFGLATQHGEKIRLAGADDQFGWLIQKAKAGKAGADSRWHPPSPVIHPPASECRTMASSSSSSSSSEEKPKKKSCGDKPRPSPDSRMNPLRDLWLKLWKEKYGIEPHWSGQEAKLAKGLLAYLDRVGRYSDLESILQRFLDDDDELTVKNQHPFSTIAKSAHKYLSQKVVPLSPVEKWARGLQ